MRGVRRVGRLVTAVGVAALPLVAWSAAAGADTSLVGYNASTLAIGAQFAFNIPGVVPLPNENLIEEDVPFARTNVGGGPVVDALAAPYFPGDIAADLGSLLATFGAPALPLNDPLLAESKFPTSPGYPSHKTFGIVPSAGTPLLPSIFSSVANSSANGGDATGTVSDLALSNLSALSSVTNSVTKALGLPSAGASLIDVGNTSANNSVVLGPNAITATSTTQIGAIGIAGLINIAGLTSTASATSDGVTGTPTATLKLGSVTVDGQSAYIDDKGVHIATSNPSTVGITPQQLQHSIDSTLAQDGISIRVLDPVLTTTGPSAKADAGGLVISLSHQIDVPFIPGEPTIPVPALGNVGLPAGLYTATTSITFGLAQANVSASGLSPQIAVAPNTSTDTTLGGDFGSTLPSTLGTGFGAGSVQTLTATGAGSAAGSGVPPGGSRAVTGATAFPILGVPSPVGWTVAALLACILVAYPMLLLARWQFLAGRRA
jgi:hypothetical protein